MAMFGLFVLAAASLVFGAINMLQTRLEKRGGSLPMFFQAIFIAAFFVLLVGPIVFLVLSATAK